MQLEELPKVNIDAGKIPISRAGWLGAAALGVLLLLVTAGFVLAERAERAERQAQLIGDALWVEQTLRFVLVSGAEEIDRLGSDIRSGLPMQAIADQLVVVRRLHPELVKLSYTNLATGESIDEPATGEPDLPPLVGQVAAALKLGESQYGPAFRDNAGNWRFQLVQPVTGGNGRAVIVASFDLRTLLSSHIPWWVASKNLVSIRDQNNLVLATKSVVDEGLSPIQHVMPFEPPGQGLALVVTPYTKPVRWHSWALPATIALLAAIIAASLLILQRNVRRRQIAEEQLRAESAFRRSMEDALTVGMRARDRNGKIIYANQKFCDMVGWRREDLVGSAPPMPYWDSENLEQTVTLHDSILAGEVPAEGFEIRFRRSNGEPLDALIYEAPLRDASGRHIGWMASILDVTERKRMGELSKTQADELARTARLVSVGEMASTLAHEINQPLTAISSYASGLASRMERGKVASSEVQSILAKLSSQAKRAGGIIHHLREFTRRSESKLTQSDLRDVARRTVGFLDADLAKHGVAISLVEDLQPCAVRGDEVLLEQVILNLVRNAAEAVHDLPKERRTVELRVRRIEGSVQVSVRDFGPGIPMQMRDRLFVPFATSKASGMGMGLNICRSIVELHRGRISQADESPGCVFNVTFPAAGAPQAA